MWVASQTGRLVASATSILNLMPVAMTRQRNLLLDGRAAPACGEGLEAPAIAQGQRPPAAFTPRHYSGLVHELAEISLNSVLRSLPGEVVLCCSPGTLHHNP